MNVLESFLPPDRLEALERQELLADRADGAVLFADVSGFTPLTEAMTRALGQRRGAEELTRQLNRVYDALIAEIERFGGSVVTFSGDAALCWFDGTEGATTRAVACAWALQDTMQQFAAVRMPDGTTNPLAIKVTVACGTVRRFIAGDPTIRRIDVIAGSTVTRTSTAEHLAGPGEVLVDEPTAAALGTQIQIREWRTDAHSQERFAVIQPFSSDSAFVPQNASAASGAPLPPQVLKPWLHAGVYERIVAEGEVFLTELRPVVAMFVRFSGIDFDADEEAGEKLDRFVTRVQQILARYDGTLLELTIGDKGSYFYAAFGAPHMHEDDARRAVLAAREMFPLCSELGFIEPLQIGLSQGVMRVGSYGSTTRRMYGAQGDEVNLAARLMQEAAPGTVLVSGRIQKGVANEFDLEPLAPIRLKGKAEPLLPFVVQGLRETRVQQLQEAYYALPMIGRDAEFALVQERWTRATRGQGQIVGITARAGMGKSRLTAEIIRMVRRQRGSSYGGECQSFGTNISFLVWAPIWRAFFGMDANMPLRRQLRALESELEELAPARIEAMPLLSTVLNFPLEGNDFTRALEPEFRKSALQALLLECVNGAAQEARAEGQALLFVIEDTHWIDPASRELLYEIAAHIADLPVLLVLNYRPPENQQEHLPNVRALPNFTEIRLQELTGAQGEGLIRAKLALHAPETADTIPPQLLERVLTQAQGNPFYIEQLLDYMHDKGVNFKQLPDWETIELPTTLHRLILTRLDQLNERQQLTLKASSIIGRWFTLAHLCGYFPQVGSVAEIETDLARLQQYDLVQQDDPEPDVAYLFKHVVTHQVAYESLPYATRAMLHEAYAQFLETHDDPARALDLIAYHYDRSENLPKRREYLRRAGEAAAARFANTEAVDYITRALAIVPENAATERYDLLTTREHVYDVQGEREKQRADLTALESVAAQLNDAVKQARVWLQQGWLAERLSDHESATAQLIAVNKFLRHADPVPDVKNEIETEAALLQGVILWQQGDANEAKPHFEAALEGARRANARVTEGRALSFLGTVYRETGDLALAERYYLEQLALSRANRDVRREWSALNNLGLIATTRGDFESALHYYAEGEKITREIGDRLGTGLILSNIAIAAVEQGEYTQALETGQQARQVATAIGDRRTVCRILLNLGETYRLSGEFALAGQHLYESLAMARELGDQLHQDFALTNLAAIACDLEQWEQANGLVQEALPIAHAIGHRDGTAFLLNTLARIQAANGDLQAAQQTGQQAVEIWESLEPLVYALDAYAGLAEIALETGNLSAAREQVETIIEYLDAHPTQRGAPAALNACLTAWRVLEQSGDARAGDVLQSAYAELQIRANRITDPILRRSFMEKVRVNREIVEKAGR